MLPHYIQSWSKMLNQCFQHYIQSRWQILKNYCQNVKCWTNADMLYQIMDSYVEPMLPSLYPIMESNFEPMLPPCYIQSSKTLNQCCHHYIQSGSQKLNQFGTMRYLIMESDAEPVFPPWYISNHGVKCWTSVATLLYAIVQ